MMSMIQRQETLIRVKHGPEYTGAREAVGDIQQQTITLENNTQGLGEQIHNSNEVTQRCPQRNALPTSKSEILWQT